MQDNSTPPLVVAAAIFDHEGRVLMQRRALDRAHGGLWEFPGGKVERGETLEAALLREIDEEVGIALDPAGLLPISFASNHGVGGADGGVPLVILLYACQGWRGEVRCRDAEEVRWVEVPAITDLAMPPLDVPLARDLIAMGSRIFTPRAARSFGGVPPPGPAGR